MQWFFICINMHDLQLLNQTQRLNRTHKLKQKLEIGKIEQKSEINMNFLK